MRKIIISFCILFAALSLQAQSVNGIRIDGGNTPILVYLGGNQICLPTTTCFVANLKSGYYTVEVYATRFTRPGERVWKGERLYNERVYFKGSGVMEIMVNGRDEMRPDNRPGRPEHGGHRPVYDRYDRVMNKQLFQAFFDNVKNEPFEKDRIALINAALASSDFTADQCLQLVKFYAFDNERMKIMKMIYPRIVDKEAFFMVINSLTFSSNKKKMYDFVKEYSEH
ncbi:DUF4476 domain-containing protein [Bacteroides caecimuris]|jgi:hypothetical protein|uniref:DUF4476 domain-containing protein n=2 Tax=Bacteroides caecimuris TaxID=1796613 RepID=A0A1C7H2F6_9BACE|nr:DUF4476 domain-containing protein [Bacteroides caecimuris]ANU58805.1 hypothetical protein A4V03_15560 [Bacteroides caecimuris]OXE62703.1 hypothetical protein ADH74_15145 [Bacteroides caecimuris]QQR16272.1 DUF4476 domain-containing protein [Bacteroides caecimuris]UQA29237.1 DUF4476 domain-containing protein [Bacteroides caecimuris]